MQAGAARITMMVIALLILVLSICLRFVYTSPFARSWDAVDFALALNRYDLLAMQPHFPGYPYFILGGTLLQSWTSDPIKALALFNTIMTISSIIPVVLIVRRYLDTGSGIWFTALLLTSPGLWLMSTQPMSEAAAIAVIWWFFWSILEGTMRWNSKFHTILPLFLFGIMMGIRLSFFPFGMGILLLWMIQFKRSKASKLEKWTLLCGKIVIAICCQLIWVAGLVWSEGSPAGFVQLSLAFIKGHFSEWGGGVTSSPMPFGQRISHFFADNLVWSALLGHSLLLGIIVFCLLVATGIGYMKLKPFIQKEYNAKAVITDTGPFIFGIVACLIFYTLWAFFGQNIEKPRHISPVIGPLLLLLFIMSIRIANTLKYQQRPNHSTRLALRVIIQLLLAALTLTQFIYGASLLKRQSLEVPAVYQLNDFLSMQKDAFVIYTWEESRVLQYLGASYNYKQIFTFRFFITEILAQPDRRILLTDHVLQGFELQSGQSLRNHVKPMNHFRSDPLFEPTYSEVILYEWIVNS